MSKKRERGRGSERGRKRARVASCFRSSFLSVHLLSSLLFSLQLLFPNFLEEKGKGKSISRRTSGCVIYCRRRLSSERNGDRELRLTCPSCCCRRSHRRCICRCIPFPAQKPSSLMRRIMNHLAAIAWWVKNYGRRFRTEEVAGVWRGLHSFPACAAEPSLHQLV